MAVRLSKISISGFKTIRELIDFELRPLNVLIGPNGVGKSNLISFFRLLSWSLVSPGGLQRHVGISGGASALLHDGLARTSQIRAALSFETEQGLNQYELCLEHAAADTLVYSEERYRFSRHGLATTAEWTDLGSGHREARLIQRAETGETTARTILGLLRKFVVYQFHNTSSTARMRGKWSENDGRWLKEDAANLAPFLYRLRDAEPRYYARIVANLQLILPFFADFELEPEHGKLLLRWRERDSDVVFDASQAADGMLRSLALVSLLLQPEEDLPHLLILDEPELGLHPAAIDGIAGLIRAASTKTQVLLATQSINLLDYFEPEEVVVVERAERASTFRRLTTGELAHWRRDYTLSELWHKNVLTQTVAALDSAS